MSRATAWTSSVDGVRYEALTSDDFEVYGPTHEARIQSQLSEYGVPEVYNEQESYSTVENVYHVADEYDRVYSKDEENPYGHLDECSEEHGEHSSSRTEPEATVEDVSSSEKLDSLNINEPMTNSSNEKSNDIAQSTESSDSGPVTTMSLEVNQESNTTTETQQTPYKDPSPATSESPIETSDKAASAIPNEDLPTPYIDPVSFVSQNEGKTNSELSMPPEYFAAPYLDFTDLQPIVPHGHFPTSITTTISSQQQIPPTELPPPYADHLPNSVSNRGYDHVFAQQPQGFHERNPVDVERAVEYFDPLRNDVCSNDPFSTFSNTTSYNHQLNSLNIGFENNFLTSTGELSRAQSSSNLSTSYLPMSGPEIALSDVTLSLSQTANSPLFVMLPPPPPRKPASTFPKDLSNRGRRQSHCGSVNFHNNFSVAKQDKSFADDDRNGRSQSFALIPLPNGYVPLEDLWTRPWFNMTLGVKESENLLNEKKKEGLFVVRNSSEKDGRNFTISFYSKKLDRNVRHLRVSFIPKVNKWRLGTCEREGEKRFYRVSDCVEYYWAHGFTLENGVEIRLSEPLKAKPKTGGPSELKKKSSFFTGVVNKLQFRDSKRK